MTTSATLLNRPAWFKTVSQNEIIDDKQLRLLKARLEASESRERWLAEHFQALSQYLLIEQEDERRHLSRILHDNIGQSLTAAIINLQMGQMNGGQMEPEVLEQTSQILSDCLNEVREMSLNLRPSQLDELGLNMAVEGYLQRTLAHEHEEYEFIADDLTDRLDPRVETTAFRIIQDLVSVCRNAANALHLIIQLKPANQQLCMTLAYDCSMDDEPALIADNQWLGIRERTAMLMGDLEINNQPGKGSLYIELPLGGTAAPAP